MVWRVVWQGLTTVRHKAAVFAAVVVSPTAVLVAAGEASQPPPAPDTAAEPVGESGIDNATPVDIVAAPSEVSSAPPDARAAAGLAAGRDARAARWRVVPRFLPAGVASERGLQVRTILAARSISAEFPQIRSIGGVRADSLRWHPNGLALDVMIPDPTSSEGIALGNAVVDFVWRNADRFAVQDTIWRGMYSTPKGPGGSGNGHFDHVHVTTAGGGYPTGKEAYPR